MVSSFNFRFSYTNFVETEIAGFAIITGHFTIGLKLLSFSPIPYAKAVPLIKQYGTSAPIFTPRSINSFLESPKPKISFIP